MPRPYTGTGSLVPTFVPTLTRMNRDKIVAEHEELQRKIADYIDILGRFETAAIKRVQDEQQAADAAENDDFAALGEDDGPSRDESRD